MRMYLSTTIDAPQEAVFAAVSNFSNAAEMISGIDSVEMLDQANNGSAVGVGTRFKETRTMMGKQATEEMEVTEFDPPRSYVLSAISCGARFDSRVACDQESPGGCRLSYDIDTQAISLYAKIMSPIMGLMMKGTMRKMMEKDLADIKAYVEGGQKATAPTG